jgi:hypothetical protein
MKDEALIVCVIDRSGSMASVVDDAIGGYNTFLESQKALPYPAKWSLVLFDHEYNMVERGLPIAEARPLDKGRFVPRGNTALLDAIGRTIDDTGKELAALPESERPNKVLIAILTDGQENASKAYSQDRISSMITHQRTVYQWEFLFLAADQDAISAANRLAIPAGNAVNYANTSTGNREAFDKLSKSTASYRTTGKVNQK